MSAFPSAAAQAQPFDPFKYREQALRMQSQQQAQQLQGQQMAENALDIQQKQRDAQDQQTVMQVLGKHQGDLDSALPELASQVSAKTYLGLQKAAVETKKSVAELDNKTLENNKMRTDALLGLVKEAVQLPPDQYAQAWPTIVSRAAEIEPRVGQHLDPTKPVPPEQLAQYGSLFQTQSTALAKESGERAAKKAQEESTAAAAELPGKKAHSAQEALTLAGTNAQGMTAAQQAQNALTRRGQDMAHQEKSGDDQAVEIAAQALANGELTRLKDIVSMRGDQRLRVFARAKQLNPAFTTAELDRKIKMEDQFTNGKDGQNLQSFGTFLEHAGAASEMTNAYRTTSVKLVNTPLNKLRDLAGDASYNDFIGALEPVRKEFEGFLLGGRALYGDDRKAAEAILSDNSSPAQIQAALTRMGHTVKARFNEANFRYQRVMGHDLQDAISPEAQAGAQKIGIDLGLNNKPSAAQQAGPRRVIDLTK